ncbi:MAG: deoxyribose-phosphate aldolase [Clostridia bacterium]|nr:deoxyribose-phosphate aldolase [Clostridia bacterium]
MEIKEILSRVDHTLLNVNATAEEIKDICDDAILYGCASVCIPPSYVKDAKDYIKGRIPVCTVIGFPNGYNSTAVKCFETETAVNDGADEIDMVINIGWVKDGKYEDILNEINAVKKACNGKLLKVIIETCLLTEEEKIRMCETVSASEADFIKTSTGFSTGGATKEDIILFTKHCRSSLKIKAAGGIKSLQDAEDFIKLGAERLGTSRIVKLIKNSKDISGY